MAVFWSNPAEHFHVTQVSIRGVDPIAILSYLTSFSQLHVLHLTGVTPEVVAEIEKHLPKCKIQVE